MVYGKHWCDAADNRRQPLPITTGHYRRAINGNDIFLF
jgi:hypothetical protein